MSEFERVDLSGSGEVVTQDARLIGRMSGIEVVNDSIIAISNNSGSAQVALYNLRTGEIQSAILRGNGEKEMFRVTSMSTDPEGLLCVSGLMDRKEMTARWNDNGGTALA